MSIPEPTAPVDKPCRHEYVRIYQRKLKGLDRRLVMTRAFLPVGFKPGDFGHLGEGSYCFCSKCRARLYPKRTQAEKVAARAALAKAQEGDAMAAMLQENLPEEALEKPLDIHVEELEQEPVDMQDIEAEGVKLAADETESCSLSDEDV
ncbi:MAG TPA: hypothetical protein V6C81_09095 [Planktothrix sp.]